VSTHRQFVDLAPVSRWTELQMIMVELGPAAPYWRLQDTQGGVYPHQGWDLDWSHRFRLAEYKYIEWCELSPRRDESGLTLAEVGGVCEAVGFEIESLPDRVRALGYRALS